LGAVNLDKAYFLSHKSFLNIIIESSLREAFDENQSTLHQGNQGLAQLYRDKYIYASIGSGDLS
jgi:hypothetical protein